LNHHSQEFDHLGLVRVRGANHIVKWVGVPCPPGDRLPLISVEEKNSGSVVLRHKDGKSYEFENIQVRISSSSSSSSSSSPLLCSRPLYVMYTFAYSSH
jgi:hypothetical protein